MPRNNRPRTYQSEFGRVMVGHHHVTVYGSNLQLNSWANRPGLSWPCSYLARTIVTRAEFDISGDLVDLTTVGVSDMPADELNAWTSDVLSACADLAPTYDSEKIRAAIRD